MNDLIIYEHVVSLIDVKPYRMFDASERLSIINVAYAEAYASYERAYGHFIDYARSVITSALDENKKEYYRTMRRVSPNATYSEQFFDIEYPVIMEEDFLVHEFINSLPETHRVVALCYTHALSYDDTAELLGLSRSALVDLNKELASRWLEYIK